MVFKIWFFAVHIWLFNVDIQLLSVGIVLESELFAILSKFSWISFLSLVSFKSLLLKSREEYDMVEMKCLAICKSVYFVPWIANISKTSATTRFVLVLVNLINSSVSIRKKWECQRLVNSFSSQKIVYCRNKLGRAYILLIK